ncbi:MAG: hypothetical protein EHM47_06105, partial [Ignavibacteriales bacterium]
MNNFVGISLAEKDLSYNYNIPPLPIHLFQEIPRKEKGIPFDIFNYEFLYNDPETKNLIKNGLTIGCFYIESPGMR